MSDLPQADHAIDEVAAVIDDAEPERGEPVDPYRRVVAAAWRELGRYHALVAITTRTHTAHELHPRHAPVLEEAVAETVLAATPTRC